MVSDFIHPRGRLRVPDQLSDADLEALRLSENFATEYLKYGKDNYWTSEKMIRQVLDVALPVFRVAFQNFVGVWIFTTPPIMVASAQMLYELKNSTLALAGSSRIYVMASFMGSRLRSPCGFCQITTASSWQENQKGSERF
jgi:hypothetical protein